MLQFLQCHEDHFKSLCVGNCIIFSILFCEISPALGRGEVINKVIAGECANYPTPGHRGSQTDTDESSSVSAFDPNAHWWCFLRHWSCCLTTMLDVCVCSTKPVSREHPRIFEAALPTYKTSHPIHTPFDNRFEVTETSCSHWRKLTKCDEY